jgi:hypothetical protein
VVSATSITCTTAGKAATCGAVPVVVQNLDAQSATSSGFSYVSKAFALAAGNNIANGAGSGSAVWADFDGDGKNDVANLTAGGVGTAASLNAHLGQGDGTFAATKSTLFAVGQIPSAIAAAASWPRPLTPRSTTCTTSSLPATPPTTCRSA